MRAGLRSLLLLPIRHPRKELACIALLAGLAAAVVGRTGVPIDGRTENILAESDPSVRTYAEFRERFGTDELLLVGVGVPGRVVDPEPFALLAELTARVREVAGVDSRTVMSLASVRVPQAVPGLPPRVSLVPLAPAPPADAAQADQLAARVRQLPLLEGFLVSPDLRTACVIAMLRPPEGRDPALVEAEQVRAVEALRATVAGLARPGYELHVAGSPVVKADFVGLLRRDLTVLIPISFGLIVLVLVGLYRTWRAVVLPIACVVLAVLFTLAVMALTGHALNTITSLLPPLILSVAIGESIHLVAAWDDERRRPGAEPVAALEAAVQETALPCLLTSVTTVAGFASFELSPILPIREFGRFASLGTVCAFLLTFTLLPALLRLLPGRPPGASGRPGEEDGGRLGRLLAALARFVVGRPRTVLAVSAVPLAGSLLATLAWLEVEVDFVRYFKSTHELPRAVEFFSARLAGPAPLEIAVVGAPGAFGRPEHLRRLDELQRRLEALTFPDLHGRPIDPIDRTMSIASFAKVANQLQGGRPEVPDDPRRLAAIGLLAEMAAEGDGAPVERGLWRLLSPDLSRARISCRMQNLGSREAERLVEEVVRLGAGTMGPGFEVQPTGAAVIFLEVSQAITDGQKTSFVGALVLVFGAMLLVFRSPRSALLCIVPNLFPIAFTFGFMAVSGITLNMGTAMVASIAIGVAVDDTVHFLTGFGRHIALGLAPPEAVAATFRGVGPANLALTLILCVGFGVSMLASFYPTIHFGVLSSWTIAVAFYGDFVLLPALLVLLWPRR